MLMDLDLYNHIEQNIENDAAAKKREEKGTHNKALESAKTEAVESYKVSLLKELVDEVLVESRLL